MLNAHESQSFRCDSCPGTRGHNSGCVRLHCKRVKHVLHAQSAFRSTDLLLYLALTDTIRRGGEEHRLTIAFTKLQLRSVSFKRKSSRTGEHTCVCLCAFVHVYMCAYVAVYSAVCVVCVRDPVWLMWFCLKQVSEFCSHKIQEHDSIIKTTTLKRKQIYAITELVVCFKSSRLTAKFFITFFFKRI